MSPTRLLGLLGLVGTFWIGRPRAEATPIDLVVDEPACVECGRLAQGERIDLNRADSQALEALPGIGPALAGRILADRAEHGAYAELSELQRVRGIGPATCARIGELVTPGAQTPSE